MVSEEGKTKVQPASKGQTSAARPTPSPRSWNVGSLRALRKRLTGEIRRYADLSAPTKPETERFRALTYAYSVAAGVLRDEQVDGLVKRLDALEAKLAKKK